MINRCLLVLLSLLLLAGSIHADKSYTRLQIDDIKCDLKETKADISFLNLLNGLYFTEPQMEELLVKLYEVEEIDKETDRKYEEFYWEVQDNYKKIRKVLMENKGIPAEIEMMGWNIDGKLGDINAERKNKIAKIEQQVENDILNPNQITIINEFVDCLFPPKSLKNPIRVGQVPDIGEIEKTLDRIRNTKEKDYKCAAEDEINKTLKHIDEHHEILNEKQKEVERNKHRAAFEKTRELSDTDYEIQKYDIALTLDHDSRYLKWWVKEVKGQPGETARYLLNTRNIPIIKKRLAQLQYEKKKIAIGEQEKAE